MSAAPTLYSTLGALAAETWDLMSFGLARTDQREPDERTFTDHHFLHLGRVHPAQVTAILFNNSDEALTGADVEWWLGDGSSYLRMLVQAKKLSRNGTYKEAGRTIGDSSVRQVDRLLDICAGVTGTPGGMNYLGFLPVYLLYGGALDDVTPAPDACCGSDSGKDQRGCLIIHAASVKAQLDTGRRNARSLSHTRISPACLPWRCLLCRPQPASTSVWPTPGPASGSGGGDKPPEAGPGRAGGSEGGPGSRPSPSWTLPWSPESALSALTRAADSHRPRTRSVDDQPGKGAADGQRPADDAGPHAARLFERGELPVDPLKAPRDAQGWVHEAGDAWRPGGRLVVVTTVQTSDHAKFADPLQS